MKDYDYQCLSSIKQLCEETGETMNRFGGFELFSSDKDYVKSISMSIFQIAELSKGLSDDFMKSIKSGYQAWMAIKAVQIRGLSKGLSDDSMESIKPDYQAWMAIKAVQNISATYFSDDRDELWRVASIDIPNLSTLCDIRLELSHKKGIGEYLPEINEFMGSPMFEEAVEEMEYFEYLESKGMLLGSLTPNALDTEILDDLTQKGSNILDNMEKDSNEKAPEIAKGKRFSISGRLQEIQNSMKKCSDAITPEVSKKQDEPIR